MNRQFEEQHEEFERGTVTFSDGTEVPFAFEAVNDRRFRLTLDDETVEVGGNLQ